VSLGGTDAGRVHTAESGILSAVIGVCSRYIHTAASMIHVDDYAAAIDLIVHLVINTYQATVDSVGKQQSMKRIVGVGSTNRTKIKAVQTVVPTEEIIAVDAASNVSAQPVGDTETKTGARNRAVASRDEAKALIGIGLEGGIDIIDDLLFLCNWGALVS